MITSHGGWERVYIERCVIIFGNLGTHRAYVMVLLARIEGCPEGVMLTQLLNSIV